MIGRIAFGVMSLLVTAAAQAQSLPSVGVEATTDERRRGLSWSEGRASISGDAALTLGAFELDARVAALRGSVRQDGADAVADLGIAFVRDVGAFQLRARAIGHVFAGAARGTDYAEFGGDARYTLGPVELTAGALYAPPQQAIGGSNLYLSAQAVAGIPMTPFTLVGGIGRSSGAVDDAARADRLRPGGRYVDWRLGVEHVTGPLTLALDYVGTDLNDDRVVAAIGDRRHSGDRMLGRARVAF
ncbi:TorF family putative porin [uncultured Sphingomonas sp.]|uniref:TorF family putative porin n=1 Tax=uncultured Sphingomonas sp. TaxID=158754 RepID=UPI0025E28D85|nr:TorF family putative porin [uncultured Sphingomonas sp.]